MFKSQSKLLWQPSQKTIENSNIKSYINWLNKNYSKQFSDYNDLWQWSVDDIGSFWESIWKYFDIIHEGYYQQVVTGEMPDAEWFLGTSLNFSEHIFKNETDEYPAIIFKSEFRDTIEISWQELKEKVSALRSFFIEQGVQKGDRIVGFLPNIPEATIAFLAANSIGAIWSSTSPDFGISSVLDRFQQIEPTILIATDGYGYGGNKFDKTEDIKVISKQLPTLKKTIIISYINELVDIKSDFFIPWNEIIKNKKTELIFDKMPFNHPIWVLFSSGTTGIPKAITHSQGGILLEHLKYLNFHADIKKGERCFWYTTTGWMMWNYIQGVLLCGGTVVLYDGSPVYPDMNGLWHFVEEIGINHFGTSAGFIVANMKAGIHPGKDFDLSKLRSIGSTGSPLPPEGFDWIYSAIKKDIWLASISGGTDVCSAFVGGLPTLPVYSGEIQCRALGCNLKTYNENGEEVYDEVGEMVITKPMPSMPIYFWNDENKKKYKESYFEMYPGKWRHGDWINITNRNGIIIYGRSDSTLNRGGIRIGTSEIYRAVNQVEQVQDCLVICLEREGGEYYMPLFVQLKENQQLDDALKKLINTSIRKAYSPRHVPDEIIEIQEIPYTISGKKVETPIKKIMMGQKAADVINADALRNMDALKFFENISIK